MSSIHPIDLVVLAIYLVLMGAVGAYFVRYIHAEGDFLKGGNRVEWWVAGMGAFMSGFSVWTFTGGAGFAYRHGVIGVFLMLLAVPAFAIGHFVFATRWRRARVTTVVEYIRTRFGDGTHKTFSWMTVPSQILFGAVRLLALASFLAIAVGLPVPTLILVCGVVIVAYTTLGGYWAVCFTEMFQFMFLFPIAVLLAVLSLHETGGAAGFVERAPSGFLNPFGGEYGWLFLLAYSVSQTIGYNNFANAQRYFCADTERSARRIALLCMALFTLGSVVFYLPPLAARILMPDLGSTPNGLREPAEAAYMAIGMRLLPPGLVGVLLAAMLASSMASLSATNHVVTGIVAKDLYQGYFDPDASDARMLRVSRAASLGVGLSMIALALVLASGAKSVFTLLFICESIFLVPLGLPLLYGLLVPWGAWWCALCAYGVGAATALAVSAYSSSGAHVNETHMIGIPALATTLGFFVPALLTRSHGARVATVARFFARLATPIDPAAELGEAALSGRRQLALVGRVTMALGAVSFLLLLAVPDGRSRGIVAVYGLSTTLLGAGFALAGRQRSGTGAKQRREQDGRPVASAIPR
jgi:Na+/proline symporter